ncbi:hypothetical protein ACFPOE_04040 [Caenimonas terrae]|uniref:Uncharacterized protein n=1 Tax=Caenimonas terrae TaxID=696074 RepID=A0ABW0N888_9BURK
MIRFEPDTISDGLLRFFAMAAPEANVYVEIAAPDIRFAAIVFLAIAVFAFRKRLSANPRPALVMLLLLVVSVPPWLMSSGNGRYYLPMLLCAGPLTVGLVYLLPLTRWFRTFLAIAVLAVQTFVVAMTPPWDSWAWLPWKEAPYFHIDVPASLAAGPPTTYVTLSSISYSLIAPQFPAASRWINVSNVGAVGRDADWAQDFLKAAPGPIMLVAPSIQGEVAPDGKAKPKVRDALDQLLRSQRLALEGDTCKLFRSRGIEAITIRRKPEGPATEGVGFWVCPLRYPVAATQAPEQPVSPRVELVFNRIEHDCPRFFPPGNSKTMRINGGAVRQYSESDMKIYVLDDGTVMYKFWRALNPAPIGTVEGVLAGKDVVDCRNIRGRTGMPWDREI